MLTYYGTPMNLEELQEALEAVPNHPSVIVEITNRCVWAAGNMVLNDMPGSIEVTRLPGTESREPGYIPGKEHGLSTELFGYQVTWTDDDEGIPAPIWRDQFGDLGVWL